MGTAKKGKECVSDLQGSYSLLWPSACSLVNWISAGASAQKDRANNSELRPCLPREVGLQRSTTRRERRIAVTAESLSCRLCWLKQPVHSGCVLVCLSGVWKDAGTLEVTCSIGSSLVAWQTASSGFFSWEKHLQKCRGRIQMSLEVETLQAGLL